jgi:hypothetical protein
MSKKTDNVVYGFEIKKTTLANHQFTPTTTSTKSSSLGKFIRQTILQKKEEENDTCYKSTPLILPTFDSSSDESSSEDFSFFSTSIGTYEQKKHVNKIETLLLSTKSKKKEETSKNSKSLSVQEINYKLSGVVDEEDHSISRPIIYKPTKTSSLPRYTPSQPIQIPKTQTNIFSLEGDGVKNLGDSSEE